ncbi:MAG: cell wall hydrolase [Catonella sp.]|uniref:cell wall hydrolase n=1 Tax=Catonella sp. TaxID=2382125 RepID=UPI003F9F6BA3
MKIKIITFVCMILAGMMLSGSNSIAKAEETASSGTAIEAEYTEEGVEDADELSDDEDTEVEDEEELDADEEETPLSKSYTKKTVTKAEKKADKTPKSVIKYTDEEFKILVCVTFLEAGNQSYKGKLATANAVINRVLSKKFPNSIKGVIYQKYAGHYQFALCAPGGKLDQTMKNYGKNKGWRNDYEKTCIEVCKDALAGKTATDRKYHFFRLYYKGIENWKADGVKIDDTYYYNY